MVNKHMQNAQKTEQHLTATQTGPLFLQNNYQESSRAALMLLLGADTDYKARMRAARRLARQGAAILPLLLTTLNNTPEITTPAWPWWPPQYEHCSRLLLHLCQKSHIQLDAVLQHPVLHTSIGPVLWICVIEAAGLSPHEEYEQLLCAGLEAPWVSVRYAAAMALATRANKTPLSSTAIEQLKQHQHDSEAFHIQLTASYALLNAGESAGIETLIHLLDLTFADEVRHAAAFILATEITVMLTHTQQEQLARQLLLTLHDPNAEIAQLAIRALRHIKLPFPVHALHAMLGCQDVQLQLRVLTALEELARHTIQRRLMLQLAIPAQIVPLLRTESFELRRQACYVLVAIGGEYAIAALGTMILTKDHPAYLDAIESLRLLPDALRASTRIKLLRWLLACIEQDAEEIQIAALDSLTYILWRARTHGQKLPWHELSQYLFESEQLLHLLNSESALVRQRAVELLGMLHSSSSDTAPYYEQMRYLLHNDPETNVRSSIALIYGEMCEKTAIPDLLQALLDPAERVAENALISLERLITLNTPLISYVIHELTLLGDAYNEHYSALNRQARLMMKHWK